MISPQRPYSPYDRLGIPLEFSPRTSQIPRHHLFSSMELEGEIPTSSLGHSEVSATHTPHVDDEQGYEFPPKGFPFTGRVPSHTLPKTSGPILPPSYITLTQLILGTPSASSLYQNPILPSNAMPTSSLFIPNATYQTSVQTVVTPVPIQPMISSQNVPSFQPTLLIQLSVSGKVSVSSSTPPSRGQNVPLPGGGGI